MERAATSEAMAYLLAHRHRIRFRSPRVIGQPELEHVADHPRFALDL